MKLTGCVKFFLFSLVGVIALVFIYREWNTSLKDIWINYSSKPEPWVGIFTACVLGVTAYASYKAGESAKIAGEMLELSRESSRKDDFIKKFTLLLEQHNEHLKNVVEFLNKNSRFVYSIMKSNNHYESFSQLNGHEILSPYMRILYHILKHIDKDFYLFDKENDFILEKKKYSSLVRSLIRNDIMKLIAVNSSFIYENNNYNDYKKYQELLDKFDFFQHTIFIDKTNDKTSYEILEDEFNALSNVITSNYGNINKNYYSVIKNKNFIYENDMDIKVMVIISILFKNKLQKSALKLYTPESNVLKNNLMKVRAKIINDNSEENIIEGVIGYRKVSMKNTFYLNLEDEVKNNIDYRNQLKEDIEPLKKEDVKLLVKQYISNSSIDGDLYFEEINGKVYTFTKNELEYRFFKIKRGKEIIKSIESGSYKNYFEDINEQYDKKIKSIFSQSL